MANTMFSKSFFAHLQLYRKYLVSASNCVYIPHKIIPFSSYSRAIFVGKHSVNVHSIISEVACRKCQVQRCYSRGLLDGDTTDLQNAQKERELKNLSDIFPNPRVTLNELAAKAPGSIFDIQHKQMSVAPKGTRKKVLQNDWTCTYSFVWPQKMKFESTAKSKRQAAEKSALEALHWLHINKRIDNRGDPIYDKSVIEELNNSLEIPMKASISEQSVERITRIWEDYEHEIKGIFAATFEAATRRATATTPVVLTKDSTIDEEDDVLEDAESADETDNVSDRRKRQLMKKFHVYDEERTPLPIDEYRLVVKK